jgi:ketosteroid isomerase-like protein
MPDRAATARAYYEALDGDDYELLTEILTPEFVHHRPDRTIDGRDRFVEFMREGRPTKDTTHPLDAVFTATGDAGDVAVRGRLLAPDGAEMASFVDVFSFEGERIASVDTFTQ